MIDCIFYIGGASGSGKSYSANRISGKYSIPIIHLDDYYNIFCGICNEKDSEQLIRELSKHLVEDINKFNGTCIFQEFIINLELENLIREKCNKNDAEQLTRELSERLIKEVIKFQGAVIIEGGWIDPSVASKIREKFNGNFVPVYAGYAEEDAQDRYNFIKIKNSHWLSSSTKIDPIEFIGRQILESGDYKSKCKETKIDYIDFSIPEDGCVKMLEYFENKIWKKI
jgi:hypothetical protein